MNDQITADNYFSMIPEWVLYAEISANAVRLYCVLRRYADKSTGEAHPSRKTLGDKCKFSTDTVDRASKELEEIGALEVSRRRTESGDYTSNSYRVMSNLRLGGRTDAATPMGNPAATGGRTDAEQTIVRDNQSHLNQSDDDAKNALSPDGVEMRTMSMYAKQLIQKRPDIKAARAYEAKLMTEFLTDGTLDTIRLIRQMDVMLEPVQIVETLNTRVTAAVALSPGDRQIMAANAIYDRHENPCPKCEGSGWIELPSEDGTCSADGCPTCDRTGKAKVSLLA